MTAIEEKEVKKYIDNADVRMLKAVHAMLEAGQKDDWRADISAGERAAVETGLRQMKTGKTTPHEKVMEKHRKWLIR